MKRLFSPDLVRHHTQVRQSHTNATNLFRAPENPVPVPMAETEGLPVNLILTLYNYDGSPIKSLRDLSISH